MSREPIPSLSFVLVCVRREDKYLLVHENKQNQCWYLPAGRIELGEGVVEAAIRETLEEAGIAVEVQGLIRVEHTPYRNGLRMRFILTAEAIDDTAPKSEADEESLEAAWFTLEEMSDLNLRSDEVLDILHYLESGKEVMPISYLSSEGQAFSCK